MKAIYSDDGDPLYDPGNPSPTIASLGGGCPPMLENKISLPNSTGAPVVEMSHMPKATENNIVIINYDKIDFRKQFDNIIILFYNEVKKLSDGSPYQQWKPIPNLAQLTPFQVTRTESNVNPFSVGTIESLVNLNEVKVKEGRPLILKNRLQKTLKQYSHYVAYKVNNLGNANTKKNVFLTLPAAIDLSNALEDHKNHGLKEPTLSVTTAHFLLDPKAPRSTEGSYELVDIYEMPPKKLKRFHDPNYITVQPSTIKEDNIQSEDYLYKVFCTNDGNGIATNVDFKVYLDLEFFDKSSIAIKDAKFGPKLSFFPMKDHVVFRWTNIALTGSNGITAVPESELWVNFVVFPKPVTPIRRVVSAFADIVMGDGITTETTPTPKGAIIKITNRKKVKKQQSQPRSRFKVPRNLFSILPTNWFK